MNQLQLLTEMNHGNSAPKSFWFVWSARPSLSFSGSRLLSLELHAVVLNLLLPAVLHIKMVI